MKKLKRVPGRLSYSEIRERQDSKDRAERDAPSLAQNPEAEPTEMQVRPAATGSAEPQQPNSETDITASDRGEPARTPQDDAPPVLPEASAVETGKQEQKTEKATGMPTQPIADPQINGPETPEDQTDTAVTPTIPAKKPSRTVLLNGYVARPAYGVSNTFDTVAQTYGDKAAMSHLVDAAIKALVEGLERGDAFPMETEPFYSALPKKTPIKRALTRPVFETILQDIDPLGIMKPGTISRIILQEAVNRFIAAEKAPTR